MAVVLGLALASQAWAAPVDLPAPQPKVDISPEVRSLRGITAVRLTIAPVPRQLAGVGITIAEIRKNVDDMLRASGVTIVEDEAAPRLNVILMYATEPSNSGWTMLMSFIELHQRVKIDRTNETIEVPTVTFLTPQVIQNSKLGEAYWGILHRTLIEFTSSLNLANKD